MSVSGENSNTCTEYSGTLRQPDYVPFKIFSELQQLWHIFRTVDNNVMPVTHHLALEKDIKYDL